MIKPLTSLFKNVILLSGTPDCAQRRLSDIHAENVCTCIPKTAMDNGWICRPTLNIIDCMKDYWPDAVRKVLENEIDIYEKSGKIFKPVILVNCGSIDDVAMLRGEQWFKDRMGKTLHFVSIHSSKNVERDGEIVSITAEIDGETCTSGDAYHAIEAIRSDDSGYFHDMLPIIVAQVQMIGEGINVSAFNAVLTASNCDRTAMQQIGRALRNDFVEKRRMETRVVQKKTTRHVVEKKLFGLFKKEYDVEVVEDMPEEYEVVETFTKVKNGHASVYIINDNTDAIVELLANLCVGHDLTDECFSWGKKIDIMRGSSPEVIEESEFASPKKNRWEPINTADPEITTIMGNVREILADLSVDSFLDGDDNDGNGRPDIEELEELLQDKKDKTRVWTKSKRDLHIDEIAMKMFEMLKNAMKQQYVRQAWKHDRNAAIAMIFQDEDVGVWLPKHLNKNYIKLLDSMA